MNFVLLVGLCLFGWGVKSPYVVPASAAQRNFLLFWEASMMISGAALVATALA